VRECQTADTILAEFVVRADGTVTTYVATLGGLVTYTGTTGTWNIVNGHGDVVGTTDQWETAWFGGLVVGIDVFAIETLVSRPDVWSLRILGSAARLVDGG
jgi:hypothetical protein